jgi:hypothetical protein
VRTFGKAAAAKEKEEPGKSQKVNPLPGQNFALRSQNGRNNPSEETVKTEGRKGN